MRKIVLAFFLLAACGVTDMPPRQTVLRPGGVVTQPNQEGVLPPGTLAIGDGVRMKRQGVLEPRQSFEPFGGLWAVPPGRPFKTFERNGGFYVATEFLGDTQLSSMAPGGTNALTLRGEDFQLTQGKVQAASARNRLFITNDVAPVVVGEGLTRPAGLPPPSGIEAENATEPGEVIEDGNFTAWRAVFVRVRSDGYVVRGGVSAAYGWENVGAGFDVIPTVNVYWDSATTPVTDGYFIELYRVEQAESVDLLGDRFRLSVVYELTGTDISNGFASIRDTCPDANLGADLYVNESVDGASKSNWMPPPSNDVAAFKGAMFYAAFASWHTRALTVPYSWGLLTTAAEIENGIGERTLNGSWSTASLTITGVADITGIEVGMELRNHAAANFAAGTRIVSIAGSGSYSITLNQNPLTTEASADFRVVDVIEIDGNRISARDLETFLLGLFDINASGDTPVVAFPSSTVVWANTPNPVQGAQLTLSIPVSGIGPFEIRASNGSLYSPPLPSLAFTAEESKNDPRTNRLFFSKIDQPEAVPVDQSLIVGQGMILKMVATQDALLVFCTDGVFRVDGDGDDWSVKPFNPDLILLAPDAVDSMGNRVYALTTEGFVSLTDMGDVQYISTPLIGDTMHDLWERFENTTPALPFTSGIQVVCDKFNKEVWINFSDPPDDNFHETWIWNPTTNTFFTQSEVHPSSLVYSPTRLSIVSLDSADIQQYAADSFMDAQVVFNPVVADDLGLLKQWIDVTAFFEDIESDGLFVPVFNETIYSSQYTLEAASGRAPHVMATTLDAAYAQSLKWGFGFQPQEQPGNWKLKGVSYRYRLASETLRN